MEIQVDVLKREILEKAVSYTNNKLGLALEIVAYKKESKFGKGTISFSEISIAKATNANRVLNQRIQLISSYRFL